jgi:hypothetical protein
VCYRRWHAKVQSPKKKTEKVQGKGRLPGTGETGGCCVGMAPNRWKPKAGQSEAPATGIHGADERVVIGPRCAATDPEPVFRKATHFRQHRIALVGLATSVRGRPDRQQQSSGVWSSKSNGEKYDFGRIIS